MFKAVWHGLTKVVKRHCLNCNLPERCRLPLDWKQKRVGSKQVARVPTCIVVPFEVWLVFSDQEAEGMWRSGKGDRVTALLSMPRETSLHSIFSFRNLRSAGGWLARSRRRVTAHLAIASCGSSTGDGNAKIVLL